ncbi:MAG TPA: transglutaminase domain-containing protein [Acidimicrobiales bacterium]|nr:transglutaminase domain-containing protein [Acidimicrobiales bacterium]
MTILEERAAVDAPAEVEEAAAPEVPPPPDPGGAGAGDRDDDALPLAAVLRPVLAAAFATAAAGLVAGGIFGSWSARLTGLLGAAGGAGWTLVALRSKRTALLQGVFPLVAIAAGGIGLVLRGESPGAMPELVGDAISAGRLFRPPVPFDPGWTVILLVLPALIGFAAAWVGAALDRPKLAVAIPLPVVALTAITQPDDGELIAGLCAFLPILAALAVLFGGDSDRAAGLGGEFELKRALRGLVAAVPVVGLLVALNSASFLFPEPRYNPDDQPQKPRAVPLSAADDRVLFEVSTASDLTGPWRGGVLDIYDPDDGFWKTSPRDLQRFPADGVLSEERIDLDQLEVRITTRDLGNSTVFPTLGGTTRLRFEGTRPGGARLDPRTDLVRMESGRVPADTTYVLELPPYATAAQLETATVGSGGAFATALEAPPVPAMVRQLLAGAPDAPWARLDLLRSRLLSNVAAAGPGTPVEVPAERVVEMLQPESKASPFEIVAAEAILARWAGVPSRVGFGFDGLNDEDGTFTVRPRNSAQWLEVHFEGFGWIPLVGAPDQAESTLDADPNARFDPTIEASDDVAVEVYVVYELESLQQLYERIRSQLLRWSPLAIGAVLAYLGWPWAAKARRRAKRRRWAAGIGPRAQIAVEYAELRDLATDLNVADIWSTPLEYLYEVRDDEEHAELAWLVARALYGDLKDTVTDDDVAAAESMSASVRRRLLRAQPVQSQVLAYFSRASIRQPYSTEVPNVAQLRLPRVPRPRLRRRKRRLGGRGPLPGGARA